MNTLIAHINPMTTTKLSYLINLLDDDNQQIVHQVSNEIIQLGVAAIPDLEKIQYDLENDYVCEQIEKIIGQIQFNQLLAAFKQWTKKADNLLDGLMLMAAYQYPDLDKIWIQEKIKNIYTNINFEISRYQSPEESIQIINKYFYNTFGFSAISPQQAAPQHFFINSVLSHQKGHPILLTILYLLIAEKLNLPLHAFELNEKLLLVWGDLKQSNQRHKEDELANQISFFINLYNKGEIITKEVMQKYMHTLELPLNTHFNWIRTCSHRRLLTIVASQLQTIYWNNQDQSSTNHFEQIIAVLEQ